MIPAAKTGVLLVNLGTPDSPEVSDVRRYLREFLSDPLVIDIPALARKALLELVILPTRPRKSAAAYREVWTEEGSPLFVHGLALTDGVREQLGDEVAGVELGMRYGNPSVAHACQRLLDAGAEQLVVLPLFPQYSKSAWASAAKKVSDVLASERAFVPVRMIPPFYDAPGFVQASAAVARTVLDEFRPDRVMMSFHGLPERHVKQSEVVTNGTPTCLASADCCATIRPENRFCYRAQSYATARAIAAELDLGPEDYEVGFQSRLGRTPWIQPYSDERIDAMPREGVKRVAVLCPSFVADCLETLEEIGMRAKESFIEAGGEDLILVPCVNSSAPWVETVADWVREELAQTASSASVEPDLPAFSAE